MDSITINRCFMRFKDRAERITTEQVAETFVSVGSLMDVLISSNNQIMYGRRGTGKTHALRYFHSDRNKNGDIAMYIDAQNIGSNGSIYNNTTLSVSERSTRLLIDICSAIHQELLDVFTDPHRGWNLAEAAPILDKFVDAFTETRVSGSIESELSSKDSATSKAADSLSVSFSKGLSGDIKFSDEMAKSRVKTGTGC